METPPLTPEETMHAVRCLLDSCVVDMTNHYRHALDGTWSDELLSLWCKRYMSGPAWKEELS